MMNDPKALASLAALADKIALELVFAQPASDAGLLPINSFVLEMEELLQGTALSQPLIDGIAKARSIVDEVFAATAEFTRETLETLNAWVLWFQTAISAVTSGQQPENFEYACAAMASLAAPATELKVVDAPILLDLQNDRDVLLEFVQESREHLENIESGALKLETDPTDAATLNSVFRAFHTFKGGSGFLKLTPINKLAHELESLLQLARQGRAQITSAVVEIILNAGDTLKQFIDAIELQLLGRSPHGPIVIPTAGISERIAQVLANATPATQGSETAFIRRSAAVASEAASAKTAGSAATLKVETDKLDTLIDMVGELVIAQSLVAQAADVKTLASSKFMRSMAQLARTTKDLQRTALSLRMVPVGGTFRKMNRVIRDLSVRSGKEIELVIEGEDTELDRTIVEEIHDPLLHMIRNSVDHGIEKPETRVAACKSASGRITLSAFHQGGSVVIQIKDDGGGLNREKILRKANELGLLESGAALTDKDVFELIFAPGFSTADAVTDISGRGVGMDVVRRNIEQLRGKIEIQSAQGQGTTFSIFLPLTLAIIDGLIVRVGANRYIFPTLAVRESLRPTASMVSTVHGKADLVSVRGKHVPLLRLAEFLGVQADCTDATAAVLVVIESDGAQRCVLVDELIGKQEIVIKSLGDTFHQNPILAGAAILGDGRVGLILDVAALVHPTQNLISKAA